MENIGTIIFSLREDKDLSLENLASGVLSKSQLSKVERGLSDISATKFLKLLDKLHITFSEFNLLYKDISTSPENIYLLKMTQALISGNLNQANLIESDVWKFHTENSSIYAKLNYIMIKAMRLQIEDKKLDRDSLAFLIDYLFKVSNWTRYELILYGNTMTSIPLESINLLTKEISYKTTLYKKINLSIIINLLFNTVILNLEAKNYTQVDYFIRTLSSNEFLDIQLGERFLKEYAKALYDYVRDPVKINEEKNLNLLNILKILDSDNLFIAYSKIFEDFKNETN
ncbi:helix-turn-helix domain-containing protein [Carnobacterium inhibens]|uniref:HTH cro/C1-type domain-containing protein n=2 Tax=Carnobacterium inhibens TaxID=147709 RepID=U5SCJ6_9LACT|nr:Rgg/GadR/MutR family transcriptional regulator [Carnobacterium inhibens]AGY82965.1 hypothetical protein Q783_11680 [Carnobacterium inhibens subsp. gilichinskyi]MBC9826228.1 helix-turn-helix domain-containing protein [Carnobacterium inhibens]